MMSHGFESSPKTYVRGELHSADASGAVEIVLYADGSLTQRVLAADEYLVIEGFLMVTVAGGDAFIFVGADSTEGAGEYVARGTFAANGGSLGAEVRFVGRPGHKPYGQAPAGVADFHIWGQIRQG